MAHRAPKQSFSSAILPGMATPAHSLSPDLLRRLTYSKYLLRRANSLQRDDNELATAEAVLVAHDAAEMLMRVVVDAVGAKPPDKFMQFWQNIADKTGKLPPHKAEIDRLNNLRVGFKHLGNLPNPTTVGDLLPVVTAFCSGIAGLYLNLDFGAVSMADLIANEEARQKVKEAQTAFAEGDLENALLSLGMAYDKLYQQADEKFGFLSVNAPRNDFLQNFTQGLILLARRVNLLSVGVNPIRAQKFGQLTPSRVYSPFTGSMEVQWWRKPTAEDYEYCRDFVIDFGLRLIQSE